VTVAELKDDAAASPHGRPSPRRRRRPSQPDGTRALRPDRRAEEGARREAGVLIEDIAGPVRGNVQAGDVILEIRSRGTLTEARARASDGMLTKMEKGASVTLRLKRGEQEFFRRSRSNNGE